MFNDRYGLTKAVIESRKTMTRRLADPKSKYEELRLWQPCIEMEFGLYGYTENDGWEYIEPYYFVGEVVAVAQSYRDVCASGFEPKPPYCASLKINVWQVGQIRCSLRPS